jgi:putative membrane protein
MMNGWEGGMGAGGWVLMSLFWIVLLVAIVWAVTQLFPRRDERRALTDGPASSERAEDILDRRLALGEIDLETHAKLRQALRAGTS